MPGSSAKSTEVGAAGAGARPIAMGVGHEHMRIAMIGAGAMGSTFGARFAQAGAEVVLYDLDEAHIAAIAADGLTVTTPSGEIHVRLPATSDIARIGPVDMAVVLVDSNA